MGYSFQVLFLAVLSAAPLWLRPVQCEPYFANHFQVPFTSGTGIDEHGSVSFSDSWQILGPFKVGTREAVWGADPLECHGGFPSLPYDSAVTYDSALAANGTIKWKTTQANVSYDVSGKAKLTLSVSFPEVDWGFLQSVYGWPALQYQAWARGFLEVDHPDGQTIALFPGGLLEFSVDGKRHFGGDFYNYHRVPVILHLSPGKHTLDLRLIRDVRAMGASTEPAIEVEMEAEERQKALEFDQQSLLVSDMTQGKLGGPWASINVQNNMPEWIEIHSISPFNENQHELSMEKLLIAPYQARPLIFNITLGIPFDLVFHVDASYKIHGRNDKMLAVRAFQVKITTNSYQETQKVTFLHPAKIVSYFILRPPPPFPSCSTGNTSRDLPVMIGLHGAGLEADDAQVRKMLDAAYNICSWKLFPTGVTRWSGDDWHHWGAIDVLTAVAAIPEWIQNVEWRGPKVSVDDWILVGHSNGGQGVWYFITHYPDKVVSAAPVSGYSSIENYVPYNMWQISDPFISYVLQKSRSSFKHELLLDNTIGIPILQQHGSDDDNVPAYHSRLMHEILGQTQRPSDFFELPGRGHWFEGVLTTPHLLAFYENATASPRRLDVPFNFTITVPSSGDIGPVYGIQVDQLRSPDFNGQIKVTRSQKNEDTWYLRTRNIHRFHLMTSSRAKKPVSLVLDNQESPITVEPEINGKAWFLKNDQGQWIISREKAWQNIHQRYGRQLGAMDAILRSDGPFTIFVCSPRVEHIALQISHSLFQYFAADTRIVRKCSSNPSVSAGTFDERAGNSIILAIGDDLPLPKSKAFPINVHHGKLVLSRTHYDPRNFETSAENLPGKKGPISEYVYEEGLGALFLRPLENESLELVIWGADLRGIEQAARLVPTLTGVGQPDFLVLSQNCPCEGHAGLYAAGHFDKIWQISQNSYIRDEPIRFGSI